MGKIYCINCDCERDYTVKKTIKTFNVKGEKVKACVKEAYCKECGEPVFVYEIEKENQTIVYDTYKRKKNLLTSEDIINLRKKYGLSQRQLATIIKCGEKNIARYENGAIQDQTINLLLVLVQSFPEHFGLVEAKREKHVKTIETDYSTGEDYYSSQYKSFNLKTKGALCNA